MIDETGKVTFSEAEQIEVNRIVGERIGREGISDMKEIMSELGAWGYSGSPSEIKAAVKAQADSFRLQQAEEVRRTEIETLKDELKDELKGETSPNIIAELKAEIRAANAKLDSIVKKDNDAKQAVDEQKKNAEAWSTQVVEFNEKHPEIDRTKLDKDEKFIKFASKRFGTITEIYEDYVELVGGVQSDAVKKMQSNADRSTSSGRQSGDRTGGTFGLTPNQQSLAKDNDLTYEQYAEYLNHVKRG